MSYAWETTDEDVQTVLKAHGINVDEDKALNILDRLNQDQIVENALRYDTLDGQTAAVLSNIEDQLMKMNVIKSRDKKFHPINEEQE